MAADVKNLKVKPMEDGIYRAASGMMVELKGQDILARNLAAVNAPGYKRDFLVSNKFQQELDKLEQEDNSSGIMGTDQGALYVDFTQGVLKNTGRPLDFAIESPDDKVVFFKVTTSDGKGLFTRNGSFMLNKDRMLVTKEGHVVSGKNGVPIIFGANDSVNDMSVSKEGRIEVFDKTTNTKQEVGTLGLFTIDKKDQLKRMSANYFADPDKKALIEEATLGKYAVYHNYTEASNSDPLKTMTELIQGARGFEMNQRVIRMLEDRFKSEQSKLGPR